MKRLVWVPIVIVAVALSIGLGLKLGSGGGSGTKLPKKEPQAGNGLDVGSSDDTANKDGNGTSKQKPDDEDKPRQPRLEVTFVIEPDEPQAGVETTLKDSTALGNADVVLASDWKIEGPGLQVPIHLSGEEVGYVFVEEGFYRISHRLQLESTGLTDWVLQAVAVAAGEVQEAEEDSPSGPLLFTDASGAIDLWTEAGQIRFRVNSEALEEKSGHIENLQAKVTFVSGESSSLGPGTFRMDIPLVVGLEQNQISTFSISGKLPSGRRWEQTFSVR